MFKNYFTLKRLASELDPLLKESTIVDAFSYIRDRLTLIIKKEDDQSGIEISADPGFPYINLRKHVTKPRRNYAEFFTDLLPAKISSVSIARGDRIIKIETDKFDLVFFVRGKMTNITVVIDGKIIESFKDYSEEEKEQIENELITLDFTEKRMLDEVTLTSDDPFAEIKKNYPFIGADMRRELKTRVTNDNITEIALKLKEIVNETQQDNYAVFKDKDETEVEFAPAGFVLYSSLERYEYDSFISSYAAYIASVFKADKNTDYKKIIEKHLEKEIKRNRSKTANLKSRIEKGPRDEEYSQIANLLLINIYKIKKGDPEIQLENIYDNNKEITVKLDEKLSPKENVDKYFEKSRSEKIDFEKSKELLNDALKREEYLSGIKNEFENAEEPADYERIMKKLKLRTKKVKKEEDIQSKFKQYLIDDKYYVYVGKDAASNDLLTMRFAKQNDYWFHARSVSGSHVVLRVDNPKETIPKDVIKRTAQLAAYHSKAKTASLAPVSYTFKKYVIKRKGMYTGQVSLIRENVLMAKPEVPRNTVFVTDD